MENQENVIIGEFDLIPQELPAESHISFIASPIDMMTLWKRCSTLSNFIADFYEHIYEETNKEKSQEMVSTILNEFIENAAKYSLKRDVNINIDICLYDTILKFEITNYTTTVQKDALLKSAIDIFNADDLEELYINKLQYKMEGSKESGIGLLMLLKDYPMKTGIKVSKIEDNKHEVIVKVFCQLVESKWS